MSTLANVVQQLKKERDQAQQTVEQLEQVLKALSGLGGSRRTNVRGSQWLHKAVFHRSRSDRLYID